MYIYTRKTNTSVDLNALLGGASHETKPVTRCTPLRVHLTAAH